MKKIKIAIILAASMLFASCGAQKYSMVSDQQRQRSPFGEAYEAPCTVYDTPEQFAATGIYEGSYRQKGQVQKFALRNAKELVREKFHHSYQGLISDYSQSIGNNRGNDITNKMTSAGDQIVDIILNDIQSSCTKYSNISEDGKIECYVGIIVPKDLIADQVTNAVADVLTKEEKEAIAFDEYVYRKQMMERMKEYKEQKNK